MENKHVRKQKIRMSLFPIQTYKKIKEQIIC